MKRFLPHISAYRFSDHKTFRIRAIMELSPTISRIPRPFFSSPRIRSRIHASFSPEIPNSQLSLPLTSPKSSKSPQRSSQTAENKDRIRDENIPTMAEILEASKSQNLDLRLQTLGPFFRITARNLETQRELGKAEGLVRVWLRGKILHLDSIRLRRESLSMEKSIFGFSLFIGAVAIRYGYDCGCETAELMAINDSDRYHSKLVRFYKRIGFEVVHEVSGSEPGDVGHRLVWGGLGTRMDADIRTLLSRWCTRFKPNT